MRAPIEHLRLPITATLRQAMEAIDRNAQGAVFVVGEQSRLRGVVTDGDIRRGLLRGCTLESRLESCMPADYVALPASMPWDEVLRHLRESISIIPLLDEDGRPVDYACFRRHVHLPVTEPVLDGNELEYVMECVTTNWISSQGKFVSRFEELFAEVLGVDHALAVTNGTAALHLALAASGIGPGDEVIVPDFTFAATINAVLYTGAVPVLVDVHPDTWTMDPGEVEAALTPRTRAILPVHLYGHPCHMERLLAVAERAGLMVIEDCAESLGSDYCGVQTGALGDAGCFSFFGNKVITTGEGGMVTFKDPQAAALARTLRDHGMAPGRRYWHDHVGFNYRMTNLQAAVGVAQLERLAEFLDKRAILTETYDRHLSGLRPQVQPSPRSAWGRHVTWLYCVQLTEGADILARDELMEKLRLNGIESRPVFYPLHEMPPYRGLPSAARRFPVTERIARSSISLPSACGLSADDIGYISTIIGRELRFCEMRASL